MIKEDYVRFETAKLLKEKGFDEYCHKIYEEDGTLFGNGDYLKNSDSDIKLIDDEDYDSHVFITASTLQMAMKWLREVHNIFISIDIYSKDFKGNIKYCADIYKYGSRMILDTSIICDTYEEVGESACIYVLKNLI